LDLDEQAEIREIANYALNRAAESLEPDVGFGLLQAAAYRQSRLIEAAVIVAFDSLGATPAQLQALRTEAFVHHSELLTAASPEQLPLEIERYHDQLVAKLRLVLPSLAVDIDAVDEAIRSNGPLAIRNLATAQCASPSACVMQAYVDFYGAVSTIVNDSVDGATAGQRELITTVLTMATMRL
jgi:hypothetical protein